MKLSLTLIFCAIMYSAHGRRTITIDFEQSSWQSKIDSLNNSKVQNLIFKNYSNELRDSNVEIKVSNFTFQNSIISKIPVFLHGQSLNFIQFTSCVFNSEEINLDSTRSISRLSFYGGSITDLPLEVEDINGLEHLSIWSTSIEKLNIDFSKLKDIKELSLNSNLKLREIYSDFGTCQNLERLEIYNCDSLTVLTISDNQSILELRLGSRSLNFKCVLGLDQLNGLRKVQIDAYHTLQISLGFLFEKELESLELYCPNLRMIEVMKSLKSLKALKVNKSSDCFDQSFLFAELTHLKEIEVLSLDLDNSTSPQEVTAYLMNFPNLNRISLYNTKWDDQEIEFFNLATADGIKILVND